ncbi:MAG: PIG-L family deacetylase, partial [Eubacteriales bacterium]
HPDDIEMMAYHAISAALDSRGTRDFADINARWFSGLTVTNGAGSRKAGNYAGYTDENFNRIRAKEQHLAAGIGKYSAQIQLELTSREVKENRKGAAAKIARVIRELGPEVIYTHSLADRHETHVAVALCTIEALRMIKPKERPQKLYGMEVRGSLDWLAAADKEVFDASAHPNTAQALLGVYDTQIAGGKRYDRAVIGRQEANAAFLENAVPKMQNAVFGVDMSRLMEDTVSPAQFMQELIRGFESETLDRIGKLWT